MNIPAPLAYDLAKQRQRDLIAAAGRYRAGRPGRDGRRVLAPGVVVACRALVAALIACWRAAPPVASLPARSGSR